MSQAASRDPALDPASSTMPSSAAAQAGPDLDAVYACVADDLIQVERILQRELRSDTPFVDQLLEHSWMLGGKRIRPVLLLLAGRSLGEIGHPHYSLAAALEMIHLATLIHDDVLDEAETRRHQPTVNAQWGRSQSVLLGDYLFTHAFHVGAQSQSVEALQQLAQASNRVCEGEMRQNAWQGCFELSEEDYLRMIGEKTAELCRVACHLGASLAGADPVLTAEYAEYGRHLGVAFQIIDDILDIVGQAEEVGKTLGTDLINQKPTLPLIHCREQLAGDQRDAFEVFLRSTDPAVADLVAFLEQTDSLAYARQRAAEHAQAAIAFAQELPPSEHSGALQELARFVLQRSH